MECPSLWQSTTVFQSNLSLNFALNNTGSNDRVANVANSRTENHDHVLLVEVSSCKVCPACTANTDGTATPRVKNKCLRLCSRIHIIFYSGYLFFS